VAGGRGGQLVLRQGRDCDRGFVHRRSITLANDQMHKPLYKMVGRLEVRCPENLSDASPLLMDSVSDSLSRGKGWGEFGKRGENEFLKRW
jgi:hypothetical protein